VKAAYREVVEKLLSIFETELDGPYRRDRALALVALCVGGMVLARGVGRESIADEIRRAAYKQAISTAGWKT
jgi:hypothetical protein